MRSHEARRIVRQENQAISGKQRTGVGRFLNQFATGASNKSSNDWSRVGDLSAVTDITRMKPRERTSLGNNGWHFSMGIGAAEQSVTHQNCRTQCTLDSF